MIIFGKEKGLSVIKWATLAMYLILGIFTVFFLSHIMGEFPAVQILLIHYIFISFGLVYLIRQYKSPLAAALFILIQPIFHGWDCFMLIPGETWGTVLFILLMAGAAGTLYAAMVYQKLESSPFPFGKRYIVPIQNRDHAAYVIKATSKALLILLSMFLYFSFWAFMIADFPFYLLINFVPPLALVIISRCVRSRIAALLLVLTIGAWIMNISIDSNKLSFLNDFSFLKHWPLTIFLILALLISIRLLQTTIAFHRYKK